MRLPDRTPFSLMAEIAAENWPASNAFARTSSASSSRLSTVTSARLAPPDWSSITLIKTLSFPLMRDALPE